MCLAEAGDEELSAVVAFTRLFCFLIAAHVSRSHRASCAKAVLHSLVCCGVVQADIPRSVVIIGITSASLVDITLVVIIFFLIVFINVVIIFTLIVFIDIVGTVHRSGIWRGSN